MVHDLPFHDSLPAIEGLLLNVQNRGNEPDKQARDAAYQAKDAVVDAANKVQDKASNMFDSSKGSDAGQDIKQSAQKAGDKVIFLHWLNEMISIHLPL